MALLIVKSNFISAQKAVDLSAGMKITSSVIISPKEFTLDASSSLDSSLIIIEGDNIIVDFGNAIVHSSSDAAQPDQFHGVAIFIHNSHHVTLKNAVIHGYKIAVRAENVEALTIENCDFSYNYRKHLNSTQDREDVSDWMSYHRNDKDEWLHYGAGIYLRSCDNALIQNNHISDGQCALMMMNCNNGKILNNNFSFNSGIGIGMYRCSNNELTHNTLDWNIRGFSFGIYNRGQDSAGILAYEQSNNNVFAYNSATHSGDGFFLWAGQTTMDSGEGGCNDNLIFGNNFSYASNNGVEATFSRNNIINNRIAQCDYGIWGGYSYNTIIGANQIDSNETGIAIEHGQHNQILYNRLLKNNLAVKLWANQSVPKDWGYSQHRDTRSTNYFIEHNFFSDNEMVYEFTRCDSIFIDNNHWNEDNKVYKPNKTNQMINFGLAVDSIKSSDVKKFIAAFDPNQGMKIPGDPANSGRPNIIITEWGPYDFQRPLLWLDHTDSTGKMFFRILGRAGKWRSQNIQGVKLSRTSGNVPDTISARKIPSSFPETKIELQYTGDSFIDEFGRKISASQLVNFSYEKFELPIKWTINYYKMDTFNPVKYPGVFPNAVKMGSVKTDSTDKIEFTWWGAPDRNVPEDHFALVATAQQNFPKGDYTFGITADDGVRLYVDGKLVMNEWDDSNCNYDDELHHEVSLHLEGMHQLKIEYYDQTGFATLMLHIRKQ
ncbi:MAG: right-handed parallel beta-helix repeat-containing protein [Chitinophagales bacterium]